MEAELRGKLELAADELVEELVNLARVETGEAPVSTEYVLGMLEVTLYWVVDKKLSEDDLKEMDEDEIIAEVRQIAHRRENDVRTALNQDDESEPGDARTQLFNA
jgi:hypothetical protein